jgi:hypothetical protein
MIIERSIDIVALVPMQPACGIVVLELYRLYLFIHDELWGFVDMRNRLSLRVWHLLISWLLILIMIRHVFNVVRVI